MSPWSSLLGDVRFFKEKSALTECSPRASCFLEQKVGGSWIWVVQKTKNISCCSPRACIWVLFVVRSWSGLSWRSLLGDMRFFEEKSALAECSPRASCYLEQKVIGSWILCCLKTVVLKKSSEWCAFFLKKKVHSLSVAPEPLAIWNKELEGLDSKLFKLLRTSSFAAPS